MRQDEAELVSEVGNMPQIQWPTLPATGGAFIVSNPTGADIIFSGCFELAEDAAESVVTVPARRRPGPPFAASGAETPPDNDQRRGRAGKK